MSPRLVLAFMALCAALLGAPPAVARSVFETMPRDPRAEIVRGIGDGRADDTAAIQQAIDAAADRGGKAGGGALVFLPTGSYRISRTLYLWPGVRLFGVGKARPTILLADNTPGFQRGVAHMIVFAGARRGDTPRVPFPVAGAVPSDAQIADANSGTFYTAIANIDLTVGAGNPATAAIRAHAAQHSFVSHMTMDLGSALTGLYQVGNYARDLVIRGGRYAIMAEKTSPAWQFTLVDSTLTGQRDAAIREHEAALTMVNVAIRDTPVGIDIDPGYGDRLWGKDVRFEGVSRAGIVISNERSPYTQIGFDNAVAARTPVFARFRDSGRTVAGPGAAYRVRTFSAGLSVPALGQMGELRTSVDAQPLAALPRRRTDAVRALPPVADWFDVRAAGAKGDEQTDDTATVQHAIDAHRIVYFPTGRYRVTGTLRLRPDSVLVALHPSLAQLVVADGTPAFAGVGAPVPLVESARGGAPMVVGLGLNTGGVNPRATALLWRAGEASLAEDVKVQGGHGTFLADGSKLEPYNANSSGDLDPARRWDAQYPSLWVTDGGGGTFANIWTPSTYAQAGLLVSDTATPGHVYQLSAEHHARVEIALDRVANWEFLAPQTEEEGGESKKAVAIEIRSSHDLLFANLHAYRVTRTTETGRAAVTLYDSTNVRFRNVHVNAESGAALCDENGCATVLRANRFPFENAILDVPRNLEVREREFAALDLGASPPPAALDARVERLAGGFDAAGGAAVAPDGTLFFVDRTQHRIYRFDDRRGLGIERDQPLDPVALVATRSGDLLVQSSAGRNGTVYSVTPGTPATALTVVPPTPLAAHPGAAIAMPGNWWVNGEFRDQYDPAADRYATLAELFAREAAAAPARAYVSPDGSVAIPAYRVFQLGPPDWRAKRFSHALDTMGLVTAPVGGEVVVSNASEARTYRATVGAGGALANLRPLTDRGGESVAVDAHGRVYVANGQVFVYAPDGRELRRIDVPERPVQLIFGRDGALFILSQRSLFRVRP